MSRRLPVFLTALYLLPWGIQCLVNNFIPVYVASLPFATAQTVGDVVGLGAVITVFSQLLWSFFAGKAKNKSNVLALSLLLLGIFSLLFLIKGITKPLLFLFVTLFYSSYMAHQPLIDTIVSENYAKTRFSFGFYRSFASLGYALMAILLALLPNGDTSLFFLYAAILAAVSLVLAKTVPCTSVTVTENTRSSRIFSRRYICFLVYTLILFFCSSAFSAFFSVYYTSAEYLGGDISSFSILVSVSALAEWLLVMLFAKINRRIGPTLTFLFVPLSGVFRAFTVYIAATPATAALSFIGCALWFGILWSAVTPYITSIVSAEDNAFAHGVWSVVSSGLGGFTGSFVSGRLVESLDMKTLFLLLTAILAALALLTPVLIPFRRKAGK
ncbi:MAG: MFS transporter [Clostridia bacterium]|nr:MFS transporter [Clostridia bacterium]